MSDESEPFGGEMTRRAFLRGEFLSPDTTVHRGSDSDEPDAERANAEGAECPPESRGPAVDLDAIVGRAESIAGVAKGDDATPHPHYQHSNPTDDEGDGDE